MDLLYTLATVIYEFMESSPGLVLSLLLLTTTGAPVTLVHELGHALAARVLVGGEAAVTVGGAGKLAERRLGEITVSLNALSRPDRVAGFAEFDDSRATARHVLMIALAGPAVSFLGAVLTGWAYSTVSGGMVRDVLWAATLAGVFAVLNVVPLSVHERRDGPTLRTDGRLALDALRVVWVLP